MTRNDRELLSVNADQENRRDKLLQSKVEPISEMLKDAEVRSNEAIALLNSHHIATSLFAKAPIDFLERTTVADLAHITQQGIAAVDSLLKRRGETSLIVEQRADGVSFWIALGDRPFIVNTVNECLASTRFEASVFLHPILQDQSMRVSLSFLEFPDMTAEQTEVLKQRFEKSFSDLILATDDFASVLVRTETLARVVENPSNNASFPEAERREIAEFLRWLVDGGFIFLGHAEWRVDADHLAATPAAVLGLFRSAHSYRNELIEESRQDAAILLERAEAMLVTRLNTESTVHRFVRMVNITLVENSTSGKTVAVHSFIGMLTSKARAQESSSVPLIRQKLRRLLDLEEVVHNSHDYKYLVDIIDSMPKDEALRMDLDALREIVHTILNIQHKSDTRASVRFDPSRRGASLLIVMPRDRFNSQVRQRIQAYVESLFGAIPGSSEYHLNYSNKPFVRFYFYVPFSKGEFAPIEVTRVESEIADLSRTWRDNLRERLEEQYDDEKADFLWLKYSDAFSAEYQAIQNADECLHDIDRLEQLSGLDPLMLSMSTVRGGALSSFTVIAYSLMSEITISKALPILEHSGLEVVSEQSSRVSLGQTTAHVYRFLVRTKSGALIQPERFHKLIGPGLTEVFLERAEDDALNSLMLNAGLDIRSIALLRTYCSLLWQVNKFASRGVIFDALATVPTAAIQLWNMFDIRFNHRLSSSLESRGERFSAAMSHYKDSLRDVSDITKDRILRALAALLENTVRTNFFLGLASIALKISSRNVDIMPQPRPLFEIYVRSPLVEGIHLRSAEVSRGGIRWSDRPEDFRSEVLGLMNTQTIKNVLIVPDGAKGGFVVRQMPQDQDAIPAAVQNAYREFIRSLLSITDNRVEGEIRHPEHLVMWDAPDPYLVVAADKGTATFSDMANTIAVEEFDFWLGDAFASGGSCGYDHKKYGITARGAWESAKRHFRDIGFDYVAHSFTLVGIGDMSGDVFGNGLILSEQMKLVAAFDHRHIFVDPTPDPVSTFQERKRLFELPKSKWTDYRSSLISAGGGIFGRYEKEITVTPEMRLALGIGQDTPDIVNGEQLISLILRAPVDLLWNGGIGTYVKSRYQSHADVNDGTNDRVRIDADELRVKIVAEGGNLGLTQLARVGFSERGGLINTDAIDNSGGVDLSDHEVNLKILFQRLIRTGELSKEARDALLLEVAPQVVEAVLSDNRHHALVLSLAVKRSRRNIGYYHSFIASMAKMGYLARGRDCLPDDDELNERAAKKQGMLRPELAICIAASKRWMKQVLLQSDLLSNPLLSNYVIDYFPEKIQRSFQGEILNHPLARNIIATQITNTLVNSTGVTFLHRMCLKHSVPPATVLTCALAAEAILRLETLRKACWRFDSASQHDVFYNLSGTISLTLREATSWLISYHGATLSLEQMVELYQARHKTLMQHAEDVFHGEEKLEYTGRLSRFQTLGLDDFSARSFAVFPEIMRVFEMLWTSRRCRKNITLVATVFSQVLNQLNVSRILKLEPSLDPQTKWEAELLSHSYDEMRRSISMLTSRLIERNIVYSDDIARAICEAPSYEQIHAALLELRDGTPAISAIAVLAKLLRQYELGATSASGLGPE